jgi:hypothetical protein
MFIAVSVALATAIRKDDGPRATGVMKTKNVKHEFDVTIHTEGPFGFSFTIATLLVTTHQHTLK